MAQKICKVCGSPIVKGDPCVPFENRYAHEFCYNNYVKGMLDSKLSNIKKESKNKKTKKTSTAKPKAELKEKLTEEEYKDKRQYYEYLKGIIDGDLTPKIYTLSEGYITRYGVTWKDLYNSLVYLNEIRKKELVGDVVGIIPFFISESQQFFKEVLNVEENIKDKNINKMYQQKTVLIKPSRRKVKQIDITTV